MVEAASVITKVVKSSPKRARGVKPESPLNLDFVQARPVLTRNWQTLQIWLVGCGGTGSWLAPSLARLVAALRVGGKGADLTFVDPDVVEPKNVLRQNFCHAEIGVPKAAALAMRYSAAWGLDIPALSEPFDLRRIAMPGPEEMYLLVGCVDNAAARRTIFECVTVQNAGAERAGRPPAAWWLDCGNHAESGQVLLGSSSGHAYLRHAFEPATICRALPTPAVQRPELLEDRPEELPGADLSCAELAAQSAQSLMVNQGVAAVAADYALRLVMAGGLRKFATYLDLPSGASRSLYTTPEEVGRVLRKDAAWFGWGGKGGAK
jgi:PRTRC genetic system ThiF family protein